jgi:hypothetical protein
VICVECGATAGDNAKGWKAYLTDDEEEPAEAAIYCPDCAELEFSSDETS